MVEGPSGKNILLVEGNPDLRSAAEDLLASAGHLVTAVGGVTGAIEHTLSTRFDLAIVNAYPGEGEGGAIVDRLREHQPGLPALLISGFGDDPALRQRVLAGNVGFLALPFSRKSLVAAVEQSLAQKPASIREIPAPEAPTRKTPVASLLARSRPLLAAAALVLGVGLAVQLSRRAPDLPPPNARTETRATTIEPIAPVGDIDRLPAGLAWLEHRDAVRYRVTVFTVDDSRLWQTETNDSRVALPAFVSDQLQSNVSYFWQVEALGENSSLAGRSPMIAFRSATSDRSPEEVER